jgi:saccharopine dehydrogenase-like NADP-dependent oxidoreductase
MLDLLAAGRLPQAGFVKQEDVPLDAFVGNRFGRVYAMEELSKAA